MHVQAIDYTHFLFVSRESDYVAVTYPQDTSECYKAPPCITMNCMLLD